MSSKPPKIDRKELKNPDEFMKKGFQFFDFLGDHRMGLWVAVGSLVGLAVIYEGYGYWSNKKASQSWEAYYEAEKQPEKDRWNKLSEVAKQFSGWRAAYFAEVAVADHSLAEAKKAKDLALTKSQAQAAGAGYSRAMEFKGLLSSERQLLLVDRGNAAEIEGNLEAALKDYQEAGKISAEGTGLALWSEARVWDLKKDSAKATALYEKISTDFPNSELSKMAKQHIKVLKSPLLTSGIASGKAS